MNFYLMPTITSGADTQQVTTPKYAATALANTSYSSMPYGGEGVALVSLTNANAALAAEVDVYSFPSDLTQRLAPSDVTALVAFAQLHNIPSSWIAAGVTFQSVLTQLAQVFLVAQFVYGATGSAMFAGTQNTPATPLAQAAIALPSKGTFDFSKAQPSATLGDILVTVGQQFNLAPSSVAALTPVAGAVTTTPVMQGAKL